MNHATSETESASRAGGAFSEKCFRAGQAWELIVFDRLAPEEREAFNELLTDPDFYGLLKPRQGGERTLKAATRDTALLLFTLGEPGPLPFFVRREPEAAAAIAGLVLDGVLELEHQGEFLSGAAALDLLAPADPAGLEPGAGEVSGHPLAELSRQALCFAAAAGATDLGTLTQELYGFHRLPLSPRWSRLLPDAEAVLAWLGLGRGTSAREATARVWELGAKDESPGWIYFGRRGAAVERSLVSFKLYVSPAIEELAVAFTEVLAVAARHGVGRLKIGCDASGLLRPDKLVLYFGSLDGLLAVARELERRLAGVAAHGVPFTAPIDAAGLLSWGSDPPQALRPLSWQGPESWRSWLAGRLASALQAAGPAEPDQAARFALERLRRDGVDVLRWVPTATLFQAA